jgi:hypothetical protein
MRSLVLAGAVAIGIGLLDMSGVSAAPANGIVIGNAVAADQLVQDVRWHGRHWRWGSRGHHWRWGSRGHHWRWGSRRGHWRWGSRR